jgi:O-antigen/teichoic acid export membrane protein
MQSLLYSCKRLTMAVFGEQILRPLAMVGTLLILFAARPEPATARDAIVADTIAAGLVIAVYTLALALAMGRDVLVARPRFEVRTWLGVSLPLFLMAGMQVLFNQTDIIMLGILDTPEVTGAYAAAGRIARLVLFGLTAMSSVLAPMIAEAYHGNRLEQLDSVLRYSARILAVFTIVVTLALAFGGGFVLGLFGESFRVAWGPLVVLLVGQGINSCAGPVAYLLTLTGHHRTAAVIAGTCSLANIVLNAVLIPIWGIWGAAAATAVSVAAWNLWMLVAARRAVGVNPSAFRRSWS